MVVAGVPDTHKGELVKAWIVSQPGAAVSEGEVCAHCRLRLGSYKVPVQVEFTTALPRSPLGKVLRRELREVVRAASH
jgi:long-chain acyl-CoA synthetase